VVLYPEDARYLVGESTVTHYQIVDQVEPAPRQAREPRARSRRAACTGPAGMRRRREPPASSRTPCRRALIACSGGHSRGHSTSPY
jgi:hypothetical protein